MNESEEKKNETFNILEHIYDMNFKVNFIRVLQNINPNVDWNHEVKSISDENKSDEKILKLLRARSWIDQDIEQEYDYVSIYERLHETFDSIFLEFALNSFENIDLNENNFVSEVPIEEVLKEKFPNHKMSILNMPIKGDTKTQTIICGNTSNKPGETDIVLTRK